MMRAHAPVSQRRVSEPGRTDSVGVSVGADGPLTTLTRNLLSSYLLSHSFLKAFAPLNCGYARALRDEAGRGGRSSSWGTDAVQLSAAARLQYAGCHLLASGLLGREEEERGEDNKHGAHVGLVVLRATGPEGTGRSGWLSLINAIR